MSALTNLGGGVWAGGPALPRPPEQPPEPKVPAAVVYLERPDGRVLALTRGTDYADWHLPGGKWEPGDGEAGNVLDGGAIATGPNLRRTAWREVSEETGIRLDADAGLRPLVSYRTRSGRPVLAFVAVPPVWCPEHFPRYPAGQPAWVPPGMLTLPWATFAHECALVLRAVADDRARRSQ